MKKFLIGLPFLLLFSWQIVGATQPIMPGEMTIEFVDCQRDDLMIDLLVPPLTEGQQEDVLEGRMPAHGVLEYDGYESAQAYNETFWYNQRGCTHDLSVGLYDNDDFYILIYDTSGGIHYLEKYNMEDVGYDDDYSHYTTLFFDETTGDMTVDVAKRHNPFLALYVILFFFLIVIPIGYVAFGIVYHKSLFKNAYPELNGKPYQLMGLGSDVLTVVLVYVAILYGTGMTIGILLILMAQFLGGIGWMVYADKKNDLLDRTDIITQFTVKFVIAVLIGGIFIQLLY